MSHVVDIKNHAVSSGRSVYHR